MRELWIGVACVAALAGCAQRRETAPAPESASGVTRTVRSLGYSIGPSSTAPLADFVPAVPAFVTDGRCSTIPTDSGRLVLLSFENGPGGAERNVSLQYDAVGTLVSYADVRGDLLDRGGPLTSVNVDLAHGTAQATNTNAGALTVAEGRTDEALASENLGVPRDMIERIKRQCGSGAE